LAEIVSISQRQFQNKVLTAQEQNTKNVKTQAVLEKKSD
jgi:hypothetical protein